jgi:hypothetical protein
MKKFFKNCENCEGWGYNLYNDDFEQNPVYDRRAECHLCDEGKVINTDEVEFKVSQIEEMLDGFAIRVSIFNDMSEKCYSAYLFKLGKKFKDRAGMCQKAIYRLSNYKLKLENL